MQKENKQQNVFSSIRSITLVISFAASEVTTLWRYRNWCIIIIVIIIIQ